MAKMNNILLYESWMNKVNEGSSYNNMGFTFDDIMKVQDFLVKNAYMNSIRPNGKPAIDGKFGDETRESLINFQNSKGLEANGTIDSKTLSAMGLNIIVPLMQQSTSKPNPDIKPGVEKLSEPADSGEDFIEIIDPSAIGVAFNPDFKPHNATEWIQKGYKNFINLTFFEPDYKPSGNFYSKGVNMGEKLNRLGHWPMMILKPELKIVERGSEALYPVEAFSGSDLLIKNGSLFDISGGPSEMALRPRTGVGITAKGDVIAYVTPKSNLKGLAEKMKIAGAVYAISMDGGGSTIFVRNSEIEFPSRRRIPTILYW